MSSLASRVLIDAQTCSNEDAPSCRRGLISFCRKPTEPRFDCPMPQAPHKRERPSSPRVKSPIACMTKTIPARGYIGGYILQPIFILAPTLLPSALHASDQQVVPICPGETHVEPNSYMGFCRSLGALANNFSPSVAEELHLHCSSPSSLRSWNYGIKAL